MSRPAGADLRLAMWSGPRNISTAMMRAWENRSDCSVDDEPLYGAWLKRSGAAHPMADEVMAAMDCDWRRVVQRLSGPLPAGVRIHYQKHMTHHLLPDMLGDWMNALEHVLLIREPEAVVRSYREKHDALSPEALGVPQQLALYEWLCESRGEPPLIIDSRQFLGAPEAHLRALCAKLGLPFQTAMLSWPAGPRDSDGVWAPHWYQAVHASTGFAAATARPKQSTLQGEAARVAAACRPTYETLFAQRLIPDG